MKFKILTLICLILFMLSTAYSQPTYKRLYRELPNLRVGDGYLTYDHLSLGESALNMSDTQIHYSDLQNSIYLYQTIDRVELTNMLNVDFSASGGINQFSAEAMVNYLRYIANTQYTENFTFLERIYSTMSLDISRLPSSTMALNQQATTVYTTNGIQMFTNRYGNTFISQLPMGAMLIANLKFNFASLMDKQKFDASLSGGFGSIFNAALTIKMAAEKSKAHATIEVSVYQLGGDPSELANIFAKKPDKPESGYYLTRCSLENLKDCQAAIDGIIRYAQTNFSKQIKAAGTGKRPEGNLAVVGAPFVVTYSSKFNLLPAPLIDPGLLQQRIALTKEYQALHANKIFIDHYINSPAAAYFKPETDKLIRDIQANLDWNISLYQQFDALRCYLTGAEGDCPVIIKNIEKFTKPINQETINYYQNSGYYEYRNNCTFIPVGHPDDEYPVYANYCFDQWIKGLFTIKMTPDKKQLHIKGDYASAKHGHHVILDSVLTTQDAAQSYTGIGCFHDLTTQGYTKLSLLVRRIKNNA